MHADPILKADIHALLRSASSNIPITTTDLRTIQASVLYNQGWGREIRWALLKKQMAEANVSADSRLIETEVKAYSFEEYLASIPPIPEWPDVWNERFDRTILVDPRVGLTVACKLAKIRFEENDQTFVNHEKVPPLPAIPYWMCCQDGRHNRDRSPVECRESFPEDEVDLVAIEGVALYVQDTKVIRQRHFLVLAGSVRAVNAKNVPHLGRWGRGPGLYWDWDESRFSDSGSASRGIVRKKPEEQVAP